MKSYAGMPFRISPREMEKPARSGEATVCPSPYYPASA
jgi:hypothetical protein